MPILLSSGLYFKSGINIFYIPRMFLTKKIILPFLYYFLNIGDIGALFLIFGYFV